MSRNQIVVALGALLALGGTGYSQKDEFGKKQVVLDVKFITVSDDSLKELGTVWTKAVPGHTDIGQLEKARDGLTDLATSPLLSGQVGLVLKGGRKKSPAPDDDGKPDLQLAGVDENGRIRLKPGKDMDVELWDGFQGGGESHTPAEPFSRGEQKRVAVARALAVDPKPLLADESLSELDAATLGSIQDVIADLKQQLELQKALRSSYTEITKTAKDNPTDENKEAAAQARKSIQTVIYQKAVFEAALNYATELSRAIESAGDGGAMPDVSSLPEEDPLRKKAEVHQRAIDALQAWESKRSEQSAASKK